MTTQERLDFYLDAERRVLEGQSIRQGDRTLQMADLAEIRKAISQLQTQLAQERGARHGSLRHKTVVFS